MKALPLFRNALLMLIGLLSALCCTAAALELSDIHMPMKRSDADATLSKDYSYSVMADGSVRRTWSLGDKQVIIDFDTVSNDAIMVAVVYNKAVAKKKGIEDAHALAAGLCDEEASWDSPKDKDAKTLIENTYGLKNARRKKLTGDMQLFYETNAQKTRIERVSLFARMPHTNRWALTVLTKGSGKTAMGNQMSASFISELYDDEARRQMTVPSTPAATSSPAEPQVTAPQMTVTVTQRSATPKPAAPKPAKPTPAEPAPATPHVATTPKPATPATATTPTTTTSTTPAATDTTERMEPGKHVVSLLPPPPSWLKSIGVEEPTWWHYLGVGIVLLLVVAFTLQSMAASARRAKQRRRFVDVVAQGGPAPKRRRR